MKSYIELIKDLLEERRNIDQAGPMEKYMKNKFPFLGIKKPERQPILKNFYHQSGILKEAFQEEFIYELWDQPEREYQYVALEYITKMMKQLNKNHISLMSDLITTKSWWDTVDTLAAHPVGHIAAKSPELIPSFISGWSEHENMWLRRTAILFQLKYKEATNEEILYRFILANADSKEFFIQKAIGWALREYSKTNQESVRKFISTSTLMPLSVREGSKYI
ncbi:DNA alkylation repair protein [Bacillus sp. 1NLA3E]|uniref:DNA alkylation repair protein n=1 Tax=Bacillus sp. 1NLA3E TaxID=666686 RepID=UPI000247EF90|nr:DNA alkylation repair protein [Bacillus sp. 1NLA3E]AGK56114.1 hypothetical protein B1NLA3E_21880 [Bacillus sp. 1NLA3E]